MAVSVYIPTPFRKFTGGQAHVQAEGRDIRELVDFLETRFPGLKAELCEGDGRIRHHINVYVNGEEIRSLQEEETSLKDGDEVAFIPAMAGGHSLAGTTT